MFFSAALSMVNVIALHFEQGEAAKPVRDTRSVAPVRHHDRESMNVTYIHVCALIENGGSDIIIHFDKMHGAIHLAITEANNGILPPGVQLDLHYKNVGPSCSARNDAFKSIMELFVENITCNVYIGPGCDDAAADIYAMAADQKIPLIACPAPDVVSAIGKERADLPYLIRTSFTYPDAIGLMVGMMYGDRKWTDLAIIVDAASVFYSVLAEKMRLYLREGYPTKIRFTLEFTRSDEADVGLDSIKQALKNANSTSRVYLLFGAARFVRETMIIAGQLGMIQGEHVYIAIELYQSSVWGAFRWNVGDLRDRQAKEGYKSLLLFSLYESVDQSSAAFEHTVRRISRTKFGYQYARFENVDPVATNYYDSFILYARAVRSVHEDGLPHSDTDAILERMRNVSYTTSFGKTIKMDELGDRVVFYAVKSFELNDETFQVAVKITQGAYEIVTPIKWVCQDDQSYDCDLPPNMPKCGFDGTFCQKEAKVAPVTIAAIVVCLIVVAGAGGGYAAYRRYHREAEPFWWRIELPDIIVPTRGKSLSSLRRSARSMGDISENDTAGQKSVFGTFMSVAYKNNDISVSALPEKQFAMTRELVREMEVLYPLRHNNLHRFVGVVVDERNHCVFKAGELCSRGTLEDVLDNDSLKLDWTFKYSLMKDIAEGMTFLHTTFLESHGFLTAIACVVDSRFVVKITDYGLHALREGWEFTMPYENESARNFKLLLWRAPELLREFMPKYGTQIVLRTGPFEPGALTDLEEETPMDDMSTSSAKDIVLRVQEGKIPFFRPVISSSTCPSELTSLIERCWSEFPSERPPFAKVRETVRRVAGSTGENIVEHLIQEMEHYAGSLEERIAQQQKQFVAEKDKTEELLCQLLPRSVAAALTKGQSVDPEVFDMVTLYFSDIVGFTGISATGTAMDVVNLLNNLYTLFDAVLAEYDAYKVETIGDAYMIASGLPERNGDRHADQVAGIALDIVTRLGTFCIPHLPDKQLQIRLGLHSGPCVAGLLGSKMPRYCLIGDTVIIASRMESTGEPMKVHITEGTKALLDKSGGFSIELRGQTTLKEKGTRTTYWITGRRGADQAHGHDSLVLN